MKKAFNLIFYCMLVVVGTLAVVDLTGIVNIFGI